MGSWLALSPRISVAAPSVNSVLRSREVRRMPGTPFQECPKVRMKSSKSCFLFEHGQGRVGDELGDFVIPGVEEHLLSRSVFDKCWLGAVA